MKLNSLEDIKRNYPARTVQIELLARLFQEKKTPQIPSLIIHGNHFTGKTSILLSIFETLNVNFAWIDCQDCFSLRILLERTIFQLRTCVNKDELYEPIKSDDLTTFTVTIQNIFLKANWTNNIVLVFDHTEQLHHFRVTIPTIVLLRLSELSFSPWLTIILITTSLNNLSWGSYHVPTIYFPPYSRSEFLKIMCHHKESLNLLSSTFKLEKNIITNIDCINLWEKFCGILWDTFNAVIAGDFDLFFSISKKLWPIFIKPIEEGKATKKDIIKLYKYTQQTSALSSSKVILEELSKLSYFEASKPDLGIPSITDLSWTSKHLIIASYLASYNPPGADFTLFSKSKDNTRRKKQMKKSISTTINQRLIGPKSFALERMLAIFLIIQSDEDILTSDIYTQIENLCTLKMIIRTSLLSDKLNSAGRWKVNVSWDFVQKIAKSVNFELENYLIE